MKFRKKPVVVEAVQWTERNLEEIRNFVGDSAEVDKSGPGVLFIQNETGVQHAKPDDWIVKNEKGEVGPCDPEFFAKTYEEAGGEAPPAAGEGARAPQPEAEEGARELVQ